jgi:phage terminase small subunit
MSVAEVDDDIEPGSIPLENERRERFCRNYTSGPDAFNKGRSYESAGYKVKNIYVASANAIHLLKLPEVNQRVTWLKEQVWKELDITNAELVARAAAIARFDPAKLFDEGGAMLDMSKIDHETRMALASIETDLFIPTATKENPNPVTIATRKLKAADKLGALRLLMQYRQMIGDGSVNVGVQVNLSLADRLAAARKRIRERNGHVED